LPDDRCHCDHWGYCFKGSFRVTYLDGPEEIVRAGEAYHLRPGHFVQTLEPVELLELSPVEEHDRTMAVLARNIGAVTA
jgi:quercetin dioxygenase-like cupin family protein